MTNLNAASIDDIVAIGVEPALARTLAFWRPYRGWDDLLSLGEIDDQVLGLLRDSGVKIVPPNDAHWAAPKAFGLSAR
uniref:Uncharacterized protein n=1 Tax=Caulobacter sp. (strain K31) TaxID=366602 RepID=B0SXR1_CAUSK